MKIEMKGEPSVVQPAGAKAVSARDRAISQLLAPKAAPSAAQAQSAPVANPTSISPEEMGAIKASATEEVDEFEKARLEAQKLINDETTSPAANEDTKPEAEEPISSQYAILARKEKAIRQREEALKAKEEAIKAKEAAEAAPKSTPAAFDESKFVSRDKLLNDPFGILTELGLTYDQLTEAALNGPKPKDIELMNEIRAMKEELKALKGETETTKKTFNDYQTQTEQMGVNQLTKQATYLVENNPDYETIKETGSIGDVVDLIKSTLKDEGILLTVEEAAKQVEDKLVEEALKIARIKKIQMKLAPKAPAAPVATSTEPKQQQLKTLTNAVGTSRTLSARERAILAAEGKLNK